MFLFSVYNKRSALVSFGFHTTFLVVVIRTVFIQLFPASEDLLSHLAVQQYQSVIKLNPYRGTIYDHRYTPLAISIKTPSIAVNPRVFRPTKAESRALSDLLNIPDHRLRDLQKKENYFAWLKRKIPFKLAEIVRSLKIKGLHFLSEHSRYYTGGDSAAHILGYVGTDNTGLLGLEHSNNNILKGNPVTIMSLKDARGEQILLDSQQVHPGRSGKDLVLTLDRVIQEIAEESLKKAIARSGAKSGYILVSDPHTGRIMAIANRPGFNPNDPGSVKIDRTRNLAVSYRFEPGSVIKTFVIASAIEQKLTSPFEIHSCEKSGRFSVDRSNNIHDDHPKEFATTEEVLIHSNNICTYKIALRLGPEGLYNSLKTFGFGGQRDLIQVPGSSSGSVSPWQSWKPIRFANISFGQGILVTGLEMIQAYSAIANGGYLISPYIIERVEKGRNDVAQSFGPAIKKKVLSSEVAASVATILHKVVEEGTGKKARSEFFTTAGKTGTAEKIDPKTKSYANNKRIANFIGFAPVANPHVVIYVVLDEPTNKPYYGGLWAAPAFLEVAEKTLRYLNVAPDRMLSGRKTPGIETALSYQ